MATRDLLIKIDEAAYLRHIEGARRAGMTPSEYGWSLMEKGRLAALQPGATNVVNLSADLTPVIERLDKLAKAVAGLSSKAKDPADTSRLIEGMFAHLIERVDKISVPPAPQSMEHAVPPPKPKEDDWLSQAEVKTVRSMRAAGNSVAEIAQMLKITREQVRKALA